MPEFDRLESPDEEPQNREIRGSSDSEGDRTRGVTSPSAKIPVRREHIEADDAVNVTARMTLRDGRPRSRARNERTQNSEGICTVHSTFVFSITNLSVHE